MAGVIGRPQERAGSHGSELEAQPWWAASHNSVGGGLGHGGPVRTAGTVEGSALAGGGGGGLGHGVTLGGGVREEGTGDGGLGCGSKSEWGERVGASCGSAVEW